MHVIARPAITKAQKDFPQARRWLDSWWNLTVKARWQKLGDVQIEYPSADQVDQCLIFDVCGNKYRLIVKVSYANQWTKGTIFVKHFLTHSEYDKNQWRKDCCK